MNGRIYDPLIGRMLSADLIVPNPGDLQAFNRYAYVMNRPLSLTDPSGFNPARAMMMRHVMITPGAMQEMVVKPVAESPAGKIAVGVVQTAAGFVPYVGDAMDVKDVASPSSSGLDRGIAGASLTLNAVTAGLAPNAGPIVGGVRRIGSGIADIFRGGSDAAKATGKVAEASADAVQGGTKAVAEVAEAAPIPHAVQPDPVNAPTKELAEVNAGGGGGSSGGGGGSSGGGGSGGGGSGGGNGGGGAGDGPANPLDGTTYTQKVEKQMAAGDDHSFPSLVDSQADAANVSKIVGGDGIERTKVELPGSINGKDGNYTWIIEPDNTVNHRQFERR